MLRERDGVASAIVRMPFRERGDAAIDARFRAEDRARRERLALASDLLLAAQSRDVVGAIEAFARIVRIGHHGDIAAARVGVDGLRLHAELAGGFGQSDPVSHVKTGNDVVKTMRERRDKRCRKRSARRRHRPILQAF
ncbi:hypothetical protein PT2222_70120 [Paraburkholderia tropica]